MKSADVVTDHKKFLLIYALIALADLYVLSNMPEYRWLTKPLIMISVIVYFGIQSRSIKNKKAVRIFLAALVFAWLGDVFLIGDDNFILGLLSFLIMQALYIVCFVIGQNYYGKRETLYGAVLFLVTIGMNNLLWSEVGDMRIPVIVYTLAIGLMSYIAYTRDLLRSGYQLVWIGTIFFLVSDSVLAFNLFKGPIAFGGILVMSTYIVAQYLIAIGYLAFLEEGEE
jgi:uncharacterized membrane protein YhhN